MRIKCCFVQEVASSYQLTQGEHSDETLNQERSSLLMQETLYVHCMFSTLYSWTIISQWLGGCHCAAEQPQTSLTEQNNFTRIQSNLCGRIEAPPRCPESASLTSFSNIRAHSGFDSTNNALDCVTTNAPKPLMDRISFFFFISWWLIQEDVGDVSSAAQQRACLHIPSRLLEVQHAVNCPVWRLCKYSDLPVTI